MWIWAVSLLFSLFAVGFRVRKGGGRGAMKAFYRVLSKRAMWFLDVLYDTWLYGVSKRGMGFLGSHGVVSITLSYHHTTSEGRSYHKQAPVLTILRLGSIPKPYRIYLF